jgi:radical SAM superfamily enzyme YgiQ (UPF0313 family)
MKIALISPRGSVSKNPAFNDYWQSSPLTSTYRRTWSGLSTALPVVAALTPSENEITLIDENHESVNFNGNFDLVGISAMTQQISRGYQIADTFRSQGTAVVIGGIHATVLPEEAKLHADSVVVGEAEYSWPQLVADFSSGSVKQFYRSDRIVNMADSPIPRYDLINISASKTIFVQTSRGCVHDCEFCAASRVYGNTYRKKTIEQVEKELATIQRLFDAPPVFFSDDNLFVDKKYALDILRVVRKFNFRFMAQTDISIAQHDDLLEQLRKCGCIYLFIGFESINSKNLEQVNRNYWKMKKLPDYSKAIQRIQSHGIGVLGAFILGLDHDDRTSFRELSDFIVENHLYAVQITVPTPFPGCRMRDRLRLEDRLLDTAWDNYTCIDINFLPKLMDKEELQDGLLEVFKLINSREVYSANMNYFKQIQKHLLSEKKI